MILGCKKSLFDENPPSVGYATNQNAESSNVKLGIVAIDNESEIDKVELYLNGNLQGNATHSSGDDYEYTLDLFSIDGEEITLYAKAYDNAGNVSISEPRRYYVFNWE